MVKVDCIVGKSVCLDEANASASNYDGITVKMCPRCKSINIYRRIRQDGLSYLNKGKRGKRTIVGAINKYSCRACKNEFDVPLVGPKNIKYIQKKMRFVENKMR